MSEQPGCQAFFRAHLPQLERTWQLLPVSKIVGIDLGTTNSVVAMVSGTHPEVLRDAHGDGLVPSVVAYLGDEPLVVVPRVHWDFTTARVMAMDYIDGVPLDSLAQAAPPT